MTKYASGNPVGSTDPRDLYDNAQNMDNLENGTAPTYPDRLGVQRKSRAGMENAFDDFLAASGYQGMGTYGAGIEFTAYNQTVIAGGSTWRPAADTALPYTTTGAGMPEGGKFVDIGDAALRQELAGDPADGLGAALVNSATIYAGSVAELEALDPAVGSLVETKGYNSPGDFGANTYEIVAAGTGTADGGRFIDLPSGRQARGLFNNNIAIPQQFGAFGNAVDDDYDKVINTFAGGYFVLLVSLYGTSKEIDIPSMARFGGLGDKTGFKWVGATPATVPDKTGGTSVLRFASATPDTVALSNVFATSFKVDCAFTENLIGTSWIYCSVQSKGEFIAVRDVGINGIGHYFSKEWYASFEGLSVRGGLAGAIGFMLSSYHDQINGIPFKNLQTGNDIETAMVLDTSDGYHYQNEISGVLESGVTGVRHVGGFGVRQGKMSLYFEGFSGDTIDWTSPASPSDRTGQILWENCNFFSGAVVNFAEGGHKFVASGPIATLNASGNASVMLDGGNASTVINITGSAEVRRNSTVSRRTNGSLYASENTDPMVGETQVIQLPSGVASEVFSIPANLLRPLSSSGAVLKVSITARRTYSGVERSWEGWLTFTSGSTWVLTPFSFSSPDDSVWSVSVDSGTGNITVQYDGTDAKVVTLTHMPA